MQETKTVNGWHLPGRDKYFEQFLGGPLPKQNGFQRENLLKAFDHVSRWETAIDVGAYVGFWAADMAARFRHVYAFEPAPDSYECLVKNMAEFPNVTCINAAVGARAGRCSMIDDPKRMAEGKNVNTGSRFVNPDGYGTQMIALDDLDWHSGVDLLKIDVEGYESMVLRGADKLIRSYRPVVIMETDKKFGGRFTNVSDARVAIAQLGYREVEYNARKKNPRGQWRIVNAIHPDRIYVPNV